MNTEDLRYKTYVQILKEELMPAMGCTEPIALAYGAAKAREVLGSMPDRVEVSASFNIIKNVKSVIVPNTDGMKGIEAAVSAGIVAGDASKILEVISQVTYSQKVAIREFLETVPVEVHAIDGTLTFDIVLVLHKGEDSVKLRIAQYHTNIILIEKNGSVIFETETNRHLEQGHEVEPSSGTGAKDGEGADSEKEGGLTDKGLLNLKDILEFADTLCVEDVKDILDPQIHCNMAIAEEGLKNSYGANIGSTWLASYGNDVRNRAIAKAAAGSDARMSGCELPVVINSGSGNQGITVSVPVIEYAGELGVGDEKMYRALTLANLVSIHEKTGIGRLSAYCGAVSAGCAAACGIAYLKGGGYEEIAHTLVNSVAITSGIICDGAKPSCAGKIAASVMTGILGYDMYKNGGQQFRAGDGIVNCNVEATIRNVGRLGKEGMRETDREIVKMMIGE